MLTDRTIKTRKPTASVQRVTDGDGLYLLVQPHGGKWWRFDYRQSRPRSTSVSPSHACRFASSIRA